MPYVIDGNNLIGFSPDIDYDDPESRIKLIDLVKKYQSVKKNNIILVFDGEPENGPHYQKYSNKFRIIYPNYGESADEVIKKILMEFSNLNDVIVITSDRELRQYSKDKGAKVINSIEFYHEIKRVSKLYKKKRISDKRINIKLSEKEIDNWLKIFNDEK